MDFHNQLYTAFTYLLTVTSGESVMLVYTEHQNLFGVDENLGPVAVSLRREKVPYSASEPGACRSDQRDSSWLYQYRIIVRTGEVCIPCPRDILMRN